MQPHDTYQQAVTLDDLPAERRESLVEAIGEYVEDPDAVTIAEAPTGAAELQLPDSIPAAHKPEIVDAIEWHLTDALSSAERVVLDQRVSWPQARYEICIDYR